ncbi:class C sortase [Pseudogracilibacillus sp. SE30717A]|uniref:class C sortase n=1 Tax=Pseudogracilibacillus sp. SE30717A TaxID=3098293 RepID=UPI00300DE311
MKKGLIISVFIIGLLIFLYPVISNLFQTKEHHTMISDYHEKVLQMDEEQLQREKQKAVKHNEELAKSEMDYVDPFSNDMTAENPLGTKSYYDALQINPAIGTISIPKINVELPIYHGTGEKVLSQGVGHLENSSLPSSELGTHTVLTAHRGLPSSTLFRNLDKVEIGDLFFVDVLDETLAYEVHDIEIVLPSETEWLQFYEDENIVTLLTCDPYMINTHRMLVTGHLIPYEEKNNSGEITKKNKLSWIVIGLFIILGFLTIWGIKRYRQRKDEVI